MEELNKGLKEDSKVRKKKVRTLLQHFYNEESNQLEIGIDEVGRGPMFGRVYSAVVILPKNPEFKYELLKDSKKFTSEKKICEVAEYIKQNAVAWSVSWEDEKVIDSINIRNATHLAMHKAITNITNSTEYKDKNLGHQFYLLVDGNDFKPYTYFNNISNSIQQIDHITIEGGDNKYCSIAAASILAKVERDKYIKSLCGCYSKLDEYYGLERNKGYGTAKHMEGIKKYGISIWHRKTYGCCKEAITNSDDYYL